MAGIVIEAEDVISDGFVVKQRDFASGGAVASLLGGDDTGSLEFVFTGPSGPCDIIISTFDENDGESTLEVFINGEFVGSHILDVDTGDSGISTRNAVDVVIGGLPLNTGDTVEVRATRDGQEFVRIDQISFVHSSVVPTPAPTPSPTPTPTDELTLGDVDLFVFAGQSNAARHFFRVEGDGLRRDGRCRSSS